MAALYRITYLSPNYDQHIKQELEWLAPTDWSPDRVREAFDNRYPGAAVLAFQQITE